MYAEFFGLRELPFNNTPDPRYFFPTPEHEEALASLIYAVQERKGFVLLTGEVGAGKTLVSRMMLRHFGSSISFANVNHAVHNARDLMESVCAELELDVSTGAGHAHLVRALHDYLLTRFARNVPVVLVLDEAQNLPIDAFEQLRMIGNLEADDAKLLQIAIVGQPELQGMFKSPELRQLKQRIFRGFHLPALDRDLTEKYVRHRLTVSGAETQRIFSVDALDEVFAVSRGLPRVINTVCDNALLSAYSAGRRAVDRSFLRSVVENMVLGGTVVPPISTKTRAPRSGSIIAGNSATEEAEARTPPLETSAPERSFVGKSERPFADVSPDLVIVEPPVTESIASQIRRVRSQLQSWQKHCSMQTSHDFSKSPPAPNSQDVPGIRLELRRLRHEIMSAVTDATDRVGVLERRLQRTSSVSVSPARPDVGRSAIPGAASDGIPEDREIRSLEVSTISGSRGATQATRGNPAVQRLSEQVEQSRRLLQRLTRRS